MAAGRQGDPLQWTVMLWRLLMRLQQVLKRRRADHLWVADSPSGSCPLNLHPLNCLDVKSSTSLTPGRSLENLKALGGLNRVSQR